MNKHMFAVVNFSINGMEKINEGLGPQAGDIITKRVALRLQDIIANNKYLQLTGSHYTLSISRQDVFIVIIEPIYHLDEIEEKMKILFSSLETPVLISDQAIKLTGSIGVSIYPKDGLDSNALMMHAEAARFHARQLGGNNFSTYQPKIHTDIARQITIESQLHTALQKKEFYLQYQPIVELATGKINGVEALIRWNNPLLGMVSPKDFIQLAESNGTILPIGEWVIREATHQLAIWRAQGFKHLQLSVNLSARQLQQKDFIHVIDEILTKEKIDPRFLEFELTESEAFREEVIPIIHEIANKGISLSIDDFGTGYSTFTGLRLFHIGKIKIDKSFIDDVNTDKDSQVIVLNTISLGKRLNIRVVAEGVETKQQAQFLFEQGCDMVQGYYFSRPLAAEKLTELLVSGKEFFIKSMQY